MPDVSSLPFRIGFRAPELDHQAILGRQNISDIEGGEFGAAEAAGKAQQQQRAVAAPGQGIRQSLDHAADVGGQQRSFGLLRRSQRAANAFQRFTHRRLLHGGGRRVSGNLHALW